MKVIVKNRSATFEYFIEDRYEAGIALEGNEVKSLRLGNANLSDSFCLVKNGQVTLENAQIGRVRAKKFPSLPQAPSA